MEQKMIENVNDTRSETEFASVEDPPNIQRTVSNETTTLVSEIPNIIDKENVIIDEKEKNTSFDFK